jgi:hypothetical protein
MLHWQKNLKMMRICESEAKWPTIRHLHSAHSASMHICWIQLRSVEAPKAIQGVAGEALDVV